MFILLLQVVEMRMDSRTLRSLGLPVWCNPGLQLQGGLCSKPGQLAEISIIMFAHRNLYAKCRASLLGLGSRRPKPPTAVIVQRRVDKSGRRISYAAKTSKEVPTAERTDVKASLHSV